MKSKALYALKHDHTTPHFDEHTLADLLGVHKGNVNLLAEQLVAKEFPAFTTVNERYPLRLVEEGAKRLGAGVEHYVFVGTGGSSLGGRMLVNFMHPNGTCGGVEFHFLEAPDHTLTRLVTQLPLKKTAIIAISKSGNTLETMLITGQLVAAFRKAKIPLEGHLLGLTEHAYTPLGRLVQSQGGTLLKLSPSVGGRYSVFSPVGLLPALLAGLDVKLFCEGARQVLNQFCANPLAHGATQHAAGAVAALNHGFRAEVFMPYGQRLALLPDWWAQLWAESLGKDGRGTTPVKALGPVDQHSQLQLYLDGPNDKLYTFLLADDADPQEVGLSGTIAGLADMPLLKGLTASALVAAQAEATMQALLAAKRPVRYVYMPQLGANNLGGVLMHFMLATVVAGVIWRVNPFDQPAVEGVKLRTDAYLRERG